MKKLFLMIGVACAMSLTACKNTNKDQVNKEVTYLQVDSMIQRTSNGDLLACIIMKFDSEGNMISAEQRAGEEAFTWENSNFDEKGRFQKEELYYYDNGEKILIATVEKQYARDCNTTLVHEIYGIKQKSVEYLDTNGLITKTDVYKMDENEEYKLDFICENTYDEQKNIIKEVYSSPIDENYHVEYLYQYTYQKFGDYTQYTSILKTTADNTPISKELYEYDEVGNNTCTYYYTYKDGVEVLDEKAVVDVNYDQLSEYVYGAIFTPWQPNTIMETRRYDADGNLSNTSKTYFSEHHTEQQTKSTGSGQKTDTYVQKYYPVKTLQKPEL